MNWLEITLELPADKIESVNHLFFDIGSGVSIENPASAPSRAVVKGYLPDEAGADKKLSLLRHRVAAVLGPSARVRVAVVDDEDWLTYWRRSYKPFRVGERLVVRPPWEEYAALPGDVVIDMEPGLAFGCGTHPTTAACMELLERHVRDGQRVFDVGTGTGILAIVAAKLGAKEVWAVDNDPIAVRVARENVERNGVAGRVRVSEGHLLDATRGKADVVTANIVAEVVSFMAPQVCFRLHKGGLFITGGVHHAKQRMVEEAFSHAGLRKLEELRSGDWVALAGVKE
ncbi:MAG: 50S ribosomal protein L11 methyltransferase [Bacillota bacterium]|uniref:50S ribosomal protein L11 methyltransferase n=1 Tax=Desulforudis sp. DRI-14 TaxID=3459793 RepID=UPI00346954F3